jgi:hypothetical protein
MQNNMRSLNMKRTALATALMMVTGVSSATTWDFVGTFDMYSGLARIGGSSPPGAPDSTGTFFFDPTIATGVLQPSTGTTTSTTPFFGYTWTAHDYVLNRQPSLPGDPAGSARVAASIPFDWGAPTAATTCGVANCNIPVAAVFLFGDNGDGTVNVTTLDSDGNGAPGQPMTAGPFIGFSPAFSGTATPQQTVIPVPAAVWLFGSGLLGLVGVARRKKAAV